MEYLTTFMLKTNLEKIVGDFREEAVTLRTGRATPALVEDLEVDYYGAITPLKALASISSPEARQLVIQPWDKNAVQPIERAIRESSLGLNPATDRDSIRLIIPMLTEERRRELLKLLGRYAEDARIRVRQSREDALKELDKKEASDDIEFREKQEVQKQVDEANKKIEEVALAKEKEIMTV